MDEISYNEYKKLRIEQLYLERTKRDLLCKISDLEYDYAKEKSRHNYSEMRYKKERDDRRIFGRKIAFRNGIIALCTCGLIISNVPRITSAYEKYSKHVIETEVKENKMNNIIKSMPYIEVVSGDGDIRFIILHENDGGYEDVSFDYVINEEINELESNGFNFEEIKKFLNKKYRTKIEKIDNVRGY